MKSRIKNLSYSAILVALGVGLGYVLAFIPNVELVSFTAVLAGFMLGMKWGIIDGALMFGLYSFLSPYGMAPPPLLVAQIIGGGFLGFLGATFSKGLQKPVYAAFVGFIGTLFFDIITNASGFFAFPTRQTFIAYIIAGLGFTVIHLISNTVLFVVLFPVLSSVVEKISISKN